jgi:hypothetical protein
VVHESFQFTPRPLLVESTHFHRNTCLDTDANAAHNGALPATGQSLPDFRSMR